MIKTKLTKDLFIKFINGEQAIRHQNILLNNMCSDMMIETIALRYGNAVVYLRKCQQHAATKYVNISLNLFTSPNTTFNNTVGHKSSNDDCHENRDKDSLPSFNLGCNLEERLVIGEYCIPLASFFGL